MAGSSYSTIQKQQNQLIRKATEGSLFTAPYSAPALTTLTDPTDSLLMPLPAGYVDSGLLTTDGQKFGRSVETSETTSFGHVEPTRTDVKKDQTTVKAVLQETNKQTIALYTGVDPATLVPDATSGELSIAKPSAPPQRYYRLLCLAVDSNNSGEIYVARFLPRVKVTDFDEQAYDEGDNGITWGFTFTAYLDSVLGYSEKYFFGGPGFKALKTDMGF